MNRRQFMHAVAAIALGGLGVAGTRRPPYQGGIVREPFPAMLRRCETVLYKVTTQARAEQQARRCLYAGRLILKGELVTVDASGFCT